MDIQFNLLNITLLIAAYLFGSLSSAIITCKLMGLPDPRKTGSGNPGATNVLRTGSKLAAILTLLGDALKAVIPVLLAKALGLTSTMQSFVLLTAFWGHLYPVFFRFQGGKGVATAMGGLLALHWPLGLSVIGTWLLTAIVFRYSSLAALVAFTLAPVYGWFFSGMAWLPAMIVLSLFLLWRHRGNILRLCKGEESKIRVSNTR